MKACHQHLSHRRLWSLWDMLETWGYRYFAIGMALTYAEVDLIGESSKLVGGLAAMGPRTIDPSDDIIVRLEERCGEIEKFAEGEDIGTIPMHILGIRARIAATRSRRREPLILKELLDEVTRMKNGFFYVLHNRYFYSLGPSGSALYGKPLLFGEKVAKKFPQAVGDIERAGNCLALGEPTACVLHLDRAMEIATRRLAKKLRVTLDAKDSWGMVLGKMTDPIKQMRDNTRAEKRKKETWAECRTNLYHVKMAWRDPGAHGTESYDEKRASDILKRVGDFMQQLATLL